MKKKDLMDLIKDSIIIGDGAMGTMLHRISGSTGKAPELLVLEKPETILEIHRQYIRAGAELIETCTLGGNRIKLETQGLSTKTREINIKAVQIARQAAGEKAIVAASIGPTGKLMEPYGGLSIPEAREVYREQMSYLAEGGTDVFIIETMSDIAEMKAALLAAKDFDIPVIAQMTYTESGYTLTGTPADVAALILEGLGADIIGLNCVPGFEAAHPLIDKISKVSSLPLSIFPNAGLPEQINGETVFPETPEDFVRSVKKLSPYNIRIIGGCCGTTPEYIELLKNEVSKYNFSEERDTERDNFLYLTGNREYLALNDSSPLCIIGEKINPTGRKDIKEALKNENWSYIRKLAREQIRAGAKLLDVNTGVPGINKIEVMKKVIQELQLEIHGPLVIDSNDPEVLEAGLEVYIGRPVINSVNGEKAVMDKVFPLVKKYGAAVVGLTLDDKGIPSTVEGRLEIARRIVEEAGKYGIEKKNIIIDTLTLTAGSEQEQVMVTLETLKRVKEELGVLTTLGISNISHGLPERALINQVFLTMAAGYGLNLPIADPLDEKIHQQIAAANLITNRDKGGEEFIKKYGLKIAENEGQKNTDGILKDGDIKDEIRKVIVNGESQEVIKLTEQALMKYKPQLIIDNVLIPAIQEVGDLYDKGIYFLPQLLKSAETMQLSFDYVKGKLLQGGVLKSKGKLLIATVKGDIHDIGKNIAKTIFMNHGYEVIDLGVNVEADLILEKALQERVDLVGLSSLMTTTLEEMRKVIKLLRENGYQGWTIIGGAVTSQEFADEIGADIYARDALDGVRKANELLSKIRKEELKK